MHSADHRGSSRGSHEKLGPASISEGGSVTYGLGGSIGGGANRAAHKIGVHLKRGILLEGPLQ